MRIGTSHLASASGQRGNVSLRQKSSFFVHSYSPFKPGEGKMIKCLRNKGCIIYNLLYGNSLYIFFSSKGIRHNLRFTAKFDFFTRNSCITHNGVNSTIGYLNLFSNLTFFFQFPVALLHHTRISERHPMTLF